MRYIFILFMAGYSSCQTALMKTDAKNEILTVLMEQQRAWNDGQLEKYMNGYWLNDSLRFASDGNVSYGWKEALQRYRKGFPEKKAMGKLTFSKIEITILSTDNALVFGKWELERETDQPWGLYTLIFRKTQGGWKIVHDHSSSGK